MFLDHLPVCLVVNLFPRDLTLIQSDPTQTNSKLSIQESRIPTSTLYDEPFEVTETLRADPPNEPIDQRLLVGYFQPSVAYLSEIWLLQSPYKSLHPFIRPDEDFSFCCPEWSPDGNWIAFIRSNVETVSSSLWISQLDGSSQRQVVPEIYPVGPSHPPGMPTFFLYGWSADAQALYYLVDDTAYSVNIANGVTQPVEVPQILKDIGINKPTLYYRQYLPGQNILLSSGEVNNELTFLIAPLLDLPNLKRLEAPIGFSPIPNYSFDWDAKLSHNGEFLVVPDFEESSQTERLWVADTNNETWTLAISQPISYLPNRVSWSTDDQWIAWWRVRRRPEGYYKLILNFVSTHNWKITRRYEFQSEEPFMKPLIVGWVPGKEALAILIPDPGMGIWLLDPRGDETTDSLLIDYETLLQQLPFDPLAADQWLWQP